MLRGRILFALIFIGLCLVHCAEFGEVLGNRRVNSSSDIAKAPRGGAPSGGAPSGEVPEKSKDGVIEERTITEEGTPAPSRTEPKRVEVATAVIEPTYEAVLVHHRVKAGENLSQIAKLYRVTVQEIVTNNQLKNASQIRVGQRLLIKEDRKLVALPPALEPEAEPAAESSTKVVKASEVLHAEKVQQEIAVEQGTRPSAREEKSEASKQGFIWPVLGHVSSGFGGRRGRLHDGVDIIAPRDTPVKAARGGKVIFAKKMSGYGNLIILKHDNNLFTAYAHLQEMKMQKGSSVRQGDVIGTVGRTGRASTNHLHFEVRHRTKSVDPLKYLPEEFVFAKEGMKR